MKMKKLAIAKPPISVSPMNVAVARGAASIRARAPRPSCRPASPRERVSGKQDGGQQQAGEPERAPAPRRSTASRRTSMTPLPASGASIGEIEMTSITVAISRVAAGPVWRSRMIARGTTITVAAPSPWTNRAAISAPIVGATAQAKDADDEDADADIERRLASEPVGRAARRPAARRRRPRRRRSA